MFLGPTPRRDWWPLDPSPRSVYVLGPTAASYPFGQVRSDRWFVGEARASPADPNSARAEFSADDQSSERPALGIARDCSPGSLAPPCPSHGSRDRSPSSPVPLSPGSRGWPLSSPAPGFFLSGPSAWLACGHRASSGSRNGVRADPAEAPPPRSTRVESSASDQSGAGPALGERPCSAPHSVVSPSGARSTASVVPDPRGPLSSSTGDRGFFLELVRVSSSSRAVPDPPSPASLVGGAPPDRPLTGASDCDSEARSSFPVPRDEADASLVEPSSFGSVRDRPGFLLDEGQVSSSGLASPFSGVAHDEIISSRGLRSEVSLCAMALAGDDSELRDAAFQGRGEPSIPTRGPVSHDVAGVPGLNLGGLLPPPCGVGLAGDASDWRSRIVVLGAASGVVPGRSAFPPSDLPGGDFQADGGRQVPAIANPTRIDSRCGGKSLDSLPCLDKNLRARMSDRDGAPRVLPVKLVLTAKGSGRSAPTRHVDSLRAPAITSAPRHDPDYCPSPKKKKKRSREGPSRDPGGTYADGVAPALKKVRPRPSGSPTRPHGFSGLDGPSSATPIRIKKIRDELGISPDVELRVPQEGEVPSSPPEGFVTIHLDSLRNGMGLPLQPVLQSLLAALGLHPLQLSPACYRYAAACHVAWYRERRRAMTLDEFRSLFTFYHNKGVQGVYSPRDRSGGSFLRDLPLKMSKV